MPDMQLPPQLPRPPTSNGLPHSSSNSFYSPNSESQPLLEEPQLLGQEQTQTQTRVHQQQRYAQEQAQREYEQIRNQRGQIQNNGRAQNNGQTQNQNGQAGHAPANIFLDVIIYLWNFRFLPLRTRWRVNKYKRMLVHPSTPLGLRATLRHARALRSPPETNPYMFVLRLMWPFPTWHLPAKLPAKPRDIMAASAEVASRSRDLMYLRSMPLWRARDTPQRALYRLYEAVCANNGPMIKDEMDYFWGRSEPRWATKNLEDPQCEDPEQYAVLAAVVEELVEAFMGRLQLGRRRHDNPIRNMYRDPPPMVPETCPAWTSRVPALETALVLHAGEDRLLDGPFFSRNVWASSGYFYTT
jgi:hypothetical protein